MDNIFIEDIEGKNGQLGLITLNRPKALNALDHDMCLAIDNALQQWADDDDIKAVVIKSAEGRAFCAGGDIRALYHHVKNSDEDPTRFFTAEYRMNARLFHFPKPCISFLHGITMGGGCGISLHGSHQLATEQLMMAMPETNIGFFPDIGASYFLTRCPGKLGWYLALTGNAIGATEAYQLGLVSHTVDSQKLDDIMQALISTEINSKEDVTAVLDQFHRDPGFHDLMAQQEIFDEVFAEETIENIMTALSVFSDHWTHNTLNTLKTCSPTSLKVTLAQLQRAEKLEFDEIITTDHTMVQHFLKGHDFMEGIRAVVVDKDQQPQWDPAKVSDVTNEQVQNYFLPTDKSFD